MDAAKGTHRVAEVTEARRRQVCCPGLAGASDESFSPRRGISPVASVPVSTNVKSRLEQKCTAGEAYTPCPRRPCPDPSSVVVSGCRKWMVRVLAPSSSQKPPMAEPQWLPGSKSNSKTVQESDGRSQEHPCPRLGSP